MVRGEVEINVSEVGDVRIVCGDVEKSYGDVLPTPSSGGNSKTRRPAVGRSKSTKCMVKNIWCVTHGCAVMKSKTKKQHLEYIDKEEVIWVEVPPGNQAGVCRLGWDQRDRDWVQL